VARSGDGAASKRRSPVGQLVVDAHPHDVVLDTGATGGRTRGLDIKAGAPKLKADRAARLEAELVIDRWNRRLASGRDMLWSPTVRAALIAGTPWLDVFCPGCGTSRAINLRIVDRHPLASVGTLVLGLRCSWCPGSAPMPKLLGLYALPPAAGAMARPVCFRRPNFSPVNQKVRFRTFTGPAQRRRPSARPGLTHLRHMHLPSCVAQRVKSVASCSCVEEREFIAVRDARLLDDLISAREQTVGNFLSERLGGL
jgi:hypothetical protein